MPSFHDKVGTALPPPNTRPDDCAPKALPATGGITPIQDISQVFAGYSRWAQRGDTFYGVGDTKDALEPGLYRCVLADMIGPALVKQRVETDNLMELPGDAGQSILREFDAFWKLGPQFSARGFLLKRGFLLWGPPGGGKTSCVQLLVKRLIEDHGGIVLFLDNPNVAAMCLQMVRKIEPKRPIIAIMEDMDALVRRHGEHEYLALLDGEAQVDRIVFLASTNYPELLDRRFVDRPSRFDTIRWIGMPCADARRAYLAAKEPSLTAQELEQWVAISDGFSVAHLKEMIIAVKCFGQSLKDVVARLDEMQQRRPSSEDSPDRLPMGFGATSTPRYANGH